MFSRAIKFVVCSYIISAISIGEVRSQIYSGSIEITDYNDLAGGDVIESGFDTFIIIINSLPVNQLPSQLESKAIWFSNGNILKTSSPIIKGVWTGKIIENKVHNQYIIGCSRFLDSIQSIIILRVDNSFVKLDSVEFFPYGGFNGLYDISPYGNRFLICGVASNVPGYNFRSYAGLINNDLSIDTIAQYMDSSLWSVASRIIHYKDKILFSGIGYANAPGFTAQIIMADTNFAIDSVYVLPNKFGSHLSMHPSSVDSVLYIAGRAPTRKIGKQYGDLFVGKWHLRKGLLDTVIFGSYDTTNIEANLSVSANGKFIYFGGNINYDVPPEYGFKQSKYLVAKFDTALNMIWEKRIEVKKSYLFLNKILATSDGGVLLAGNKFDYVENPTLPKRSVYIVKLDSNGGMTTGFSEVQPIRNSFQVYPNPANNLIQIETDRVDEYSFELLNTLGQVVTKRDIKGKGSIPVEHLARGVYIYRIYDKTADICSGKIVLIE